MPHSAPSSPLSPTLLIRADAGGAMGAGHVMRMLALAQAWIAHGGVAHFASVQCPPALTVRLGCEGVQFHALIACEPGSSDDGAQTVRLARDCGAAWVALDGYHHGLAAQSALSEAGFRVLAVDDYGHADVWCADLILNQNFDAGQRCYVNRLSGGEQLLGPVFALLRREFWDAAGGDVARAGQGGPLRRILVTLGGVDADNVSGRFLSGLEAAAVSPLEVRVLLGAGNPHAAEVALRARASRHAIEVVRDCTDMPAMYRWADGVISAAGSTCYEWLYFGLPALVVAVADNQVSNARWLQAQGRAVVLAPTGNRQAADWCAPIARWLRTGAVTVTADAVPLVDAQGAHRVVAAMQSRLNRVLLEEACHG